MTAAEFNQGVDLYANAVYRFILKNIRDEDKAHDIVQDSFEKIWMKVEDIESGRMKSYLFTTAYNTMVDMLRREKKQGAWEEVNEADYAEEKSYSGLKEVLDIGLKKLSEIQRTVVMLRDYEGYSYDEIGEITGLSASQVKVYIFRARQNLRDFLVKMDYVI